MSDKHITILVAFSAAGLCFTSAFAGDVKPSLLSAIGFTLAGYWMCVVIDELTEKDNHDK